MRHGAVPTARQSRLPSTPPPPPHPRPPPPTPPAAAYAACGAGPGLPMQPGRAPRWNSGSASPLPLTGHDGPRSLRPAPRSPADVRDVRGWIRSMRMRDAERGPHWGAAVGLAAPSPDGRLPDHGEGYVGARVRAGPGRAREAPAALRPQSTCTAPRPRPTGRPRRSGASSTRSRALSSATASGAWRSRARPRAACPVSGGARGAVGGGGG